MSKQRNYLFLNNPPVSSTPPILENIFHPHFYCQIRVSQSQLVKNGERQTMLCAKKIL